MHWPFFSYKGISVLWLDLHDVEFFLNLTRQFTVPGVLNVFSREENGWFVVLVKLCVCLDNVVLNTIAISVVDSVGVYFPLRSKLQVQIILHVFTLELDKGYSGRRDVSHSLGKSSSVLTLWVTVTFVVSLYNRFFFVVTSFSVNLVVPVNWLVELDKLTIRFSPREFFLLVRSIVKSAPFFWLLIHIIHL